MLSALCLGILASSACFTSVQAAPAQGDRKAEMIKRAGVTARFEVLAWDGAYFRAQTDKDTCLYSTGRLENRENLFGWIGPIATNRWVLVAKDDFPAVIYQAGDVPFIRCATRSELASNLERVLLAETPSPAGLSTPPTSLPCSSVST